jgi:hypothetical protein
MHKMPGMFFPHPPYSPDFAPGDFHLFTYWKQFLGCTCMGNGEQVKKTVKDWFSGLAADFQDAGIYKLVTRYDMCLNLHGDYAEK